MTWQPIETAPRDGRALLLLSPDGNIGIGYLRITEFDGLKLRDGTAAWIGLDRNWSNKMTVWLGGHGPEEATHWQPLPEPPGADQGTGEVG